MATLAHRTRLYPNDKQSALLFKWVCARRKAFNFALQLCQLHRELNDKRLDLKQINLYDQWFNAAKRPLGQIRRNKNGPAKGLGLYDWCHDIPASVTQQAIKYDLKEAWRRFFKGLGKPPRFQGPYRRDSFKLSNSDFKFEAIDQDKIAIRHSKLGSMRIGDLPAWWLSVSKLNNTTFSYSGGRWYVAFNVELPDEHYLRHYPERKAAVGVDIGIAQYLATSDGDTRQAPERLANLQQRSDAINRKIGKSLHRKLMAIVRKCQRCGPLITGIQQQRQLCQHCRDAFKKSRKSGKLTAWRDSVNRANAKAARIREDMAHQASAYLSKHYELVCLEDLQLANMTRSASGTAEEPGTQVAAKAGLNRALLNLSPYRLRLYLQYKLPRSGGVLRLVDPRNTSRRCSRCGHIAAENRKTQASFICVQCGFQENADIQAARNILARGMGEW